MADPGVHYADVCTQTGAIVCAHIQQVTLRLCLRRHTRKGKGGEGASKPLSRHCLSIYADNDNHPLLLGNVHDVADASPFTTTLAVRVRPRPPSRLMIHWYADAFSAEDGMMAQELIASGSGMTGNVTLVDLGGTAQGTLSIEAAWPFAVSTPPPPTPDNPQAAALIQHTRAAYKLAKGVNHETDVFTDVHVYLDRVVRLPILWYALHAHQMYAVPDEATAYFENALAIARHLAPRATPSAFGQQQLLADMIALPSLGWIYRPDTWAHDNTDAEHWSSLFSHPGPGLPAFDCEDGSKALMELFLVFQKIELVRPSSELRHLQRLARRYTAWMAIGELKSDSGSASGSVQTPGHLGARESDTYIMHCYLMLLTRAPGGVDAPPITIESTAYASGVWSDGMDRYRDEEAREYSREMRALEALPSEQQRLNARVRSPMSLVHEQRMYGRLIALFTVDDTRGRHRLMHGIETSTFLLHHSVDQVGTLALDVARPALEAWMATELALAPRSRFPRAPPITTAHALPRLPCLLLPGGDDVQLTSKMGLSVVSI